MALKVKERDQCYTGFRLLQNLACSATPQEHHLLQQTDTAPVLSAYTIVLLLHSCILT